MEPTVRHDPEHERFVVDLGDDAAVLEYRRPENDVLDLYRTFVPESGRGQGLAGHLVAAALAYARTHGARVIPTCPYVARYIGRHPEHADLVQRDERS